MTSGDSKDLEREYLTKWWEVTRHYLLADAECGPGATTVGVAWPQLKIDSHGAQRRFISRVRGKLLRLVNGTVQREQDPLQELESTFHLQIAFIARHPEVPRYLLGWLSQGSNVRLRRRVQMVIDFYASRLARMIDRAKHQGLVRADIEPHVAAHLLVNIVQGLAIDIHVGPRQRDRLTTAAASAFAIYLDGLALPSE